MAKKIGDSFFLQHLKGKKKIPISPIPHRKESGLQKINNKIQERVMLPRDVLRLFRITHNILVQWEKLNVRFSSKQKPGDRSWRRFSIADLLCFAILSIIRDLGISLTKNKRLIDWMRNIDLIDSVLNPFLHGRKIGIYFNRVDIEGIYFSESNLEKLFIKKINKSWTPIVYVPLSELFIWILKEAGRPDFHIRILKGEIALYIDGKKATVEDLPLT